MEKILFLGKASKVDKGFQDLKIGDLSYKDYMEERGITVLEDVIESCHGCPDLMTKYSQHLQSLVEEGHKVVGVLEGGLYFALPSIQAVQTTFPIFSIH